MITLRCACGETIHADERHVGRQVRCPRCERPVEIGQPAHSPGPNAKPFWEASSAPSWRSLRARWTALTPLTRVLIGGALVGIVGILLWGPRGDAPTPSTPAEPPSVQGRPSSGSPREAGRAPVSLTTGTELKHFGTRKGLGALTVDNGTDRDAVVKLVEDRVPPRTRQAVFVRARESWTIEGVPRGRYVLRFALGADWDEGANRFSVNPVYFEFADRLNFSEVRGAQGAVRADTFTITLHRVSGGNAPANPISLDLFEASDVEWR